jgi:hypothetical protein
MPSLENADIMNAVKNEGGTVLTIDSRILDNGELEKIDAD